MKHTVALVSAPWPLFNRPSIQLGTLKAYLSRHVADLQVVCHHHYLEVAERVGYPHYQAISERTWLAESVYAALLYPEKATEIARFFTAQARGVSALEGLDFAALVRETAAVTEDFVGRLQWKDLLLAGFSACLCQLSASLYLIRKVKKRFPGVFVVLGGSSFSPASAHRLRDVFPQIDAVVSGEGEKPLCRLVQGRIGGLAQESFGRMAGIASEEGEGLCGPVAVDQVDDLNRLPAPDYGDYFALLATLPAGKRFFPTLPVEVSRGCRWSRPAPNGQDRSCAFCNLNLQWRGYRAKTAERAVTEITGLCDRHRVLSVALVDNLIPAQGADRLFEGLGRRRKDFKIFCEIRATTSLRTLERMAAAGVEEVQVGIEALSTRLLKKLRKGTTAIANLEIMKHCEALGIVNRSNLILHFPTSGPADVAETQRALRHALPFRPMRAVRFWLGLGSPVWRNPRAYGIRAVFNHPYWRRLFPPSVVEALDFMIQGYRGDLGLQRKLWRPVQQALREWKRAYEALHAAPGSGPILGYRDGGRFIIIRQRRLQGEPMTHRLEGTSRGIYLFCSHRRHVGRILAQFPGLGEERLLPFLRMMCAKRLMYEDDGTYLSLAVRI